MKHMLCVGLGYTARHAKDLLLQQGWRISATHRADANVELELKDKEPTSIKSYAFDPVHGCDALRARQSDSLRDVTHLLVSAPPDADGDPLLQLHRRDLAVAESLQWIGYLSTVGVYGDHGGGWVDEETPATPSAPRSQRRLAAEESWRSFARAHNLALVIYRLAGIYGPVRNPLQRLRQGTARSIIKPGQVFNRIHVEDIARLIAATTRHPPGTTILNVADDLPAPPQDVLAFAANLLAIAPPPDIAFHEAQLSEMARSFYAENKRVRNARMKAALGSELKFPTYREGLSALLND